MQWVSITPVLTATSVQKAAALVERLAFGDTAFAKKHWAWAIEEYQLLDSQAGQAVGAWRVAQYKLSYSWSEIAAELRLFAIENRDDKDVKRRWGEIFDAADWALCASLVYSRRHADGIGLIAEDSKHPVMAFNAACVWSQRAQYGVERLIGDAIVSSGGREVKVVATSKRSKTISWKRQLQKDPAALKRVEACYAQAMDKLRSLSASRYGQPPRDVGFLLRLAQTDVDLSFFRESESFDIWMSEHRSSKSILDTFSALRESVPNEIVKRIDELRRTGVTYPR